MAAWWWNFISRSVARSSGFGFRFVGRYLSSMTFVESRLRHQDCLDPQPTPGFVWKTGSCLYLVTGPSIRFISHAARGRCGLYDRDMGSRLRRSRSTNHVISRSADRRFARTVGLDVIALTCSSLARWTSGFRIAVFPVCFCAVNVTAPQHDAITLFADRSRGS